MAGLGQGGQPRLDMGPPVQGREISQRRVETGEESAETGEVTGDLLRGAASSGGRGPVAVIKEQRAQRSSTPLQCPTSP